MHVRFGVRKRVFVGLLTAVFSAPLAAQTGSNPPAPQGPQLSMADVVRLALERNQTLRAQRLTIDAAKADEVTASLKPNISFSFGTSGLSVFSPSHLTFNTAASDVAYDAGLGYTFERGGKRANRMTVAQDATAIAAKGVEDAERQIRFQAEQAVINVLLAKSTLDVTTQDLKSFSDFLDINQQRVRSGDLAEGDFLPISVQKLQFEIDVSSAELGLLQAKAALKQLVGFEGVPEEFDVAGELAFTAAPVTLEELQRAAAASRPDLLAAVSGVKLARDSAALERSNAVRDIGGGVDYTKATASSTIGLGVSFDLPFHDRNQGNIARADVAVRQAVETEAATRFLVRTDVQTAFGAFQTSAKVVKLYESGYLDQARRSLEITTYAFQRGASSLLNVLDAQRTYRDVQLNYRQALAALMTNARQLNFVAGKQVVQ